MNADSNYCIGKDHRICEDYSMAKVKNDFAYAIVCDGCSASPDVDFGARVLALAAENCLYSSSKGFTEQYPHLDLPEFLKNRWEEEFGHRCIRNAAGIYKVFSHLHPQALDATLLMAWVFEKRLTVIMHGDGVMVHKNKDGIKTVHINLSSGAPDYVSYHLNNRRMNSYEAIEDNKKVVWTSYNGIHNYKPFVPFVYKCEVEEGDSISIISDGINSFRKSDNTPIDWQELVDEFTAFKTTEGEFAVRRLNAFKRKCLKENIHHSDDISIASIYI